LEHGKGTGAVNIKNQKRKTIKEGDVQPRHHQRFYLSSVISLMASVTESDVIEI